MDSQQSSQQDESAIPLLVLHPDSLWSSDSDSESIPPIFRALLGISWRDVPEATDSSDAQEEGQEAGQEEGQEAGQEAGQEEGRVIGNVRKREDDTNGTEDSDDSDDERDSKRRRYHYSDYEPDPFYMKLDSGEEFYYTEEDGKSLLQIYEPNIMLRNILSQIPRRISHRLRYLFKFNHAEITEGPHHFTNIYDAVITGYIRECRLRRIFRNVLQRWRVYKMNRAPVTLVDPITLSSPEKTVTLYDWNTRRKYLFDAKSLATLMESHLLYHEYGFSVPHMPRNPWTNIEFTYIQLVSLYEQLQAHGELRWGLTTLRHHQFNRGNWELYHRPALTMKAIRASITLLDSRAAREMLEDFIIRQMEECRIPITDNILHMYSIAIQRVPNHWYLESFKCIACQYWEAEQFGVRAPMILTMCKTLFKKQSVFAKELRELGIWNS